MLRCYPHGHTSSVLWCLLFGTPQARHHYSTGCPYRNSRMSFEVDCSSQSESVLSEIYFIGSLSSDTPYSHPPPLELSPFLWGPMDENSLVSSIFPHSYIVISHQISLNLIFLNTWLVTLGHPRGQSVNQIWRFRYSGTLRSQVVWNSRFWRWKQNALPKRRSLLTIRHGDIS